MKDILKLFANLFIFMIALTPTACGYSTAPYIKPSIPSELISPCDALSDLNSGRADEVLAWSLKTVNQYYDCANKQQALAKIVEDK